ncbi:uncharacterized protein LOC132725137 [Ruditapes philippinarum]|uniref:uncharacterized protein LOC132725137 n=1 Tax=Ruditapes philippinarum TaxID=129788 RepID=UPI00295BC332|nr:uncharacterized protein LOC132725137 [Ruditapes philippinarum]
MSNEATGRPKEGPTNADILAYLEKNNGRIGDVEKRLDSLSVLEKKVDGFDRELKKLWNAMEDRNKKLDARLSCVEEKVECSDFSVAQLESKVIQFEKERDSLKNEVIYLTSQSMRNNLIFTNITEADDENQHKTERLLRSHLVDKLKVAQDLVADMKFERVHRIGERSRGKPRNIVAKFVLFKDREFVRRQWKQLQGTQFNMFEQFPKEVIEKRRRLVPKMKEHRNKGDRAWIAYDTLYVNGKAVRE